MDSNDSASVPNPSPAERIGFIGLGIMGRPMAANLARAGFEVLAFNRTRERAEELAAEVDNVTVAASPAEAGSAGVVISMVPDAPEVEAVLLGDGGAATALEPGALCIDMSTIAPRSALAIGELQPGDRLRIETPGGGGDG